jgi:hypothetical protein
MQVQGTGKYEKLLIPTAVGHPCEETALAATMKGTRSEVAGCAVAMLAAHARRGSPR